MGPSAFEFSNPENIGASMLDVSQFDFGATRQSAQFSGPATAQIIEEEDKEPSQDVQEWRNHVLVIVSNRFGLNSIGTHYFKIIKKYMKMPQFVGLVGGKPRFAYYFVGHLEKPAGLQDFSEQDHLSSEEMKYDETDRLVFLDPHCVNP